MCKSSKFEFSVSEQYEGIRLDVFIAESCDVTRSSAQKLISDGNVNVNGVSVSKSCKLRTGDNVSVTVPPPQELSVEAQDIPIKIVYEDDELLVVDKPKGMVVHPAAGNESGTLVNALLYHCKGRLSGINGVVRPGIVHRIDKNTSGLLMVAKTDNAHNHLAAQIKEHTFTREYKAVVVGSFKDSDGVIDAPIGRHPIDRKKMCVTQKNSKNAVTHYKTLERFDGYSLVSFRLETGRTHQIRVHCAHMHHPVLGDDVYGKAVRYFDGQCLHACKLGFVHPKTGKYMEFESELPDYFNNILNKLRDGERI